MVLIISFSSILLFWFEGKICMRLWDYPRSGKAPFAGHKGIHSKLFQMFLLFHTLFPSLSSTGMGGDYSGQEKWEEQRLWYWAEKLTLHIKEEWPIPPTDTNIPTPLPFVCCIQMPFVLIPLKAISKLQEISQKPPGHPNMLAQSPQWSPVLFRMSVNDGSTAMRFGLLTGKQ